MRPSKSRDGMLLLALVALIAALPGNPACGQEPAWYEDYDFAAQGVVGYWPMDGTATDYSGLGHHGTLYGDTSLVPSHCGDAAQFDGSGDYIQTAGQVEYQNELSACGWMLKSGPVENGVTYIYLKSANTNLAYQSLAYYSAPEPELIHVDVSDFSDPWFLRHPVSLPEGEWHHLCATARSGEVRIYLDGSMVAEAALSGTLDHGSFTGNFIGGAPKILFGPYSHNGLIDDVVVFDRALSSSEVLALASDEDENCIPDFFVPPPLSCEEQLVVLIADVIALNLQQGITNSLDAKLDSALDALQDANENNDGAAIGKLGAFINEVEAQRGHKIPEADADALVAAAQAIVDCLTTP